MADGFALAGCVAALIGAALPALPTALIGAAPSTGALGLAIPFALAGGIASLMGAALPALPTALIVSAASTVTLRLADGFATTGAVAALIDVALAADAAALIGAALPVAALWRAGLHAHLADGIAKLSGSAAAVGGARGAALARLGAATVVAAAFPAIGGAARAVLIGVAHGVWASTGGRAAATICAAHIDRFALAALSAASVPAARPTATLRTARPPADPTHGIAEIAGGARAIEGTGDTVLGRLRRAASVTTASAAIDGADRAILAEIAHGVATALDRRCALAVVAALAGIALTAHAAAAICAALALSATALAQRLAPKRDEIADAVGRAAAVDDASGAALPDQGDALTIAAAVPAVIGTDHAVLFGIAHAVLASTRWRTAHAQRAADLVPLTFAAQTLAAVGAAATPHALRLTLGDTLMPPVTARLAWGARAIVGARGTILAVRPAADAVATATAAVDSAAHATLSGGADLIAADPRACCGVGLEGQMLVWFQIDGRVNGTGIDRNLRRTDRRSGLGPSFSVGGPRGVCGPTIGIVEVVDDIGTPEHRQSDRKGVDKVECVHRTLQAPISPEV